MYHPAASSIGQDVLAYTDPRTLPVSYAEPPRRPIADWQAVAKRAFDIVVALLALAALTIPIILFALMIWLETPGWPFFRQCRIGMANVRFDIWKLRRLQQYPVISQQVTGPWPGLPTDLPTNACPQRSWHAWPDGSLTTDRGARRAYPGAAGLQRGSAADRGGWPGEILETPCPNTRGQFSKNHPGHVKLELAHCASYLGRFAGGGPGPGLIGANPSRGDVSLRGFYYVTRKTVVVHAALHNRIESDLSGHGQSKDEERC